MSSRIPWRSVTRLSLHLDLARRSQLSRRSGTLYRESLLNRLDLKSWHCDDRRLKVNECSVSPETVRHQIIARNQQFNQTSCFLLWLVIVFEMCLYFLTWPLPVKHIRLLFGNRYCHETITLSNVHSPEKAVFKGHFISFTSHLRTVLMSDCHIAFRCKTNRINLGDLRRLLTPLAATAVGSS